MSERKNVGYNLSRPKRKPEEIVSKYFQRNTESSGSEDLPASACNTMSGAAILESQALSSPLPTPLLLRTTLAPRRPLDGYEKDGPPTKKKPTLGDGSQIHTKEGVKVHAAVEALVCGDINPNFHEKVLQQQLHSIQPPEVRDTQNNPQEKQEECLSSDKTPPLQETNPIPTSGVTVMKEENNEKDDGNFELKAISSSSETTPLQLEERERQSILGDAAARDGQKHEILDDLILFGLHPYRK